LETSCDETSAAVIRDGQDILSNKVSSQIDLHARTGGVVPEVASRKHVEQIGWIIEEAIADAGIHQAQLGAVAVSNRPGLLGALLVGVSAAKTLAYALGIPLLAVHHIEAHIYANWLVNPEIEFPVICLVVSGGHTEIFLVRGHGDYEVLGRTRDDAAGEAFDKSARLLGFPYPGGIAIDRLAASGGDPGAIAFPRSWLGPDSLDFSFSGLKTAVLNATQNPQMASIPQADWAASIQEAIVDVLARKTMRAAREHGVKGVLLAGGVAANSRLQARFREECARERLPFTVPPPALCTDNAAMIACAGYYHWKAGKVADLSLDTIASERLA
jgi:N6-L-threonylcarbamoyladenine synthase